MNEGISIRKKQRDHARAEKLMARSKERIGYWLREGALGQRIAVGASIGIFFAVLADRMTL